MKFFLLLVFALASCHHTSPVSTGSAITASIESRQDLINTVGYSLLGQNLLHQIYLKKFDSEIVSKFNPKKDFSNDDKQMAKLIVVSKEKDQIFLVPANSNHKWLEENLSLNRRNDRKFIWVNKNLIAGKTSYLVSTNNEDVLFNERNFQMKKIEFKKVSDFSLTNLSKYQSVEVRFNKFKANPNVTFENKIKIMGDSCDHGGETRNSSKCRCQYKIATLTNDYTNWETDKNTKVNFVVTINETKIEQAANEWKLDLQNEEAIDQLSFAMESSFEFSQIFTGIPLSSECIEEVRERKVHEGRFLYDVEAKIFGTSLGENSFEGLVDEI